MTFLFTIILINSLFLLAYQSSTVPYLLNLNPENTLGTLIVFSLVGLHAVFAVLTMCLTLNGNKFIYRYYLLGLSLLVPIAFLFINFRVIVTYQTDSYYFLPISFLIYYLFIKERERIKRIINIYIKTLVNPLDTTWY